MNKLKKAALFTDSHFGKKQNSEEHNQDCLNYLDWFCDNVKKDPEIDHIWFLGDWHEHRSAINGLTLKYSYTGAKKLNDLGLRIYMLVGNHDAYYRNNLDIYTTEMFESLSNFTIINEITKIDEIHNAALGVPYLFEDEYHKLLEYANIPVIFGHFQLKGFRLTGTSNLLEHGPDATDYFKNQKKVFSGHFHAQQSKNNVHYIGSIFCMDFSDANDINRGMATYNFITDDLQYINWPDCPRYIKTKLSDLLASPKKILHKNARVHVIVDEVITLSEHNELKKVLSEKYNLREIVLAEQIDVTPDLTDIEKEVEEMKLDNVEDVIGELLKRIKSDKIDPETLTKIYKNLC